MSVAPTVLAGGAVPSSTEQALIHLPQLDLFMQDPIAPLFVLLSYLLWWMIWWNSLFFRMITHVRLSGSGIYKCCLALCRP
jgi:hypothetical protein